MAEDWDFYLTRIDDHAASVFVDLGLAESAPEADRPCLLRVSLKLQIARDDGLSDDEETETLYAIEDELFAAICSTLRARYVGRITSQGSRDYFYYGRSADGLGAAVQKARDSFPKYTLACGDKHDPDWEIYFNLLHPNNLDMQSIQNRRVVDQLVAGGDDLTQPRDIDHWLYFPSEHSRAEFTRQVEQERFRIEDITVKQPDAEFSFGVRMTRSDRVDPAAIDALVADLFLRAESCGGEYDGWECGVVRAGE